MKYNALIKIPKIYPILSKFQNDKFFNERIKISRKSLRYHKSHQSKKVFLSSKLFFVVFFNRKTSKKFLS